MYSYGKQTSSPSMLTIMIDRNCLFFFVFYWLFLFHAFMENVIRSC